METDTSFYLHLDSANTASRETYPSNNACNFNTVLNEPIVLERKPGYIWKVALTNLIMPNGIYNIPPAMTKVTHSVYHPADLGPAHQSVFIPPGFYDPFSYALALNRAVERAKPRFYESIREKYPSIWQFIQTGTLPEETETAAAAAPPRKRVKRKVETEVPLEDKDMPSSPFPPPRRPGTLPLPPIKEEDEEEEEMEITSGAESAAVPAEPELELTGELKEPFQFKMEYNPLSKKYSLRLNEDLGEMMIIDNDKLRHTLGCKTMDRYITESGSFDFPCNMNRYYSLLFVSSDILDYTMISNQMVPLLRVIPLENELNQRIHSLSEDEDHYLSPSMFNPHFERLEYYPVSSDNIKTIALNLSTELGTPLTLESKSRDATFATLHFIRTKLE